MISSSAASSVASSASCGQVERGVDGLVDVVGRLGLCGVDSEIFDSALVERSGFWIGLGEQVVVHDQLSYSQPESTPNSESRPKTNIV